MSEGRASSYLLIDLIIKKTALLTGEAVATNS